MCAGMFLYPFLKLADSAIGTCSTSDSRRNPRIYKGRLTRRSEKETSREVYVSRAGRREVKRISDGRIVDERGGWRVEGGVVVGLGGLYEGERRLKESIKFPVARFVGERGTWREMYIS